MPVAASTGRGVIERRKLGVGGQQDRQSCENGLGLQGCGQPCSLGTEAHPPAPEEGADGEGGG